MINNESLSIRFPKHLKEELIGEAEELNHTLSTYIRLIIQGKVNRLEVLERMADSPEKPSRRAAKPRLKP